MNPAPCPIFVINLPGSTARLEDAARQFASAGLAFERIEAVDGRKLPAEELARLAPDNRGAFYHSLTPGEIGCYLSHLKALRTIVERGVPAAVVFEDDFVLRPGFGACLRELLAMGDSLPDVVKLHGTRRRGHAIRTLRCGAELVRSSDPPICAVATLWTRDAAIRMIASSECLRRPFDVALKHWWDLGLDVQWVSAPVVSDSPRHTEQSTIGNRKVRLLGQRLRQIRYRWIYAVEREYRYAQRFGVMAWLRSFNRISEHGRDSGL